MMSGLMLALAVVALAGFYRLLAGPRSADRVVALDLLFAVAIAFSLCAAVASAHQAFLDVAVVLGLVGFVGTLAWSRIVEEPPGDTDGGAS